MDEREVELPMSAYNKLLFNIFETRSNLQKKRLKTYDVTTKYYDFYRQENSIMP